MRNSVDSVGDGGHSLVLLIAPDLSLSSFHHHWSHGQLHIGTKEGLEPGAMSQMATNNLFLMAINIPGDTGLLNR